MSRRAALAALALLTLAPALALAATASDRLCQMSAASAAPVSTRLEGCEQALCTRVGEQTLCSCRNADRWRFERRQGPKLLQRWPIEVSPQTGPGAFEIRRADLDGDGRAEWLVTQLDGVSNGLGVSYHTLCVLWPDRLSQAPLCRKVSEWRALTVPVQEAGRTGCSLMDAAWRSGSELGRGDGTYAVGRLLRLQDGQWVGASERPAMTRRLLSSFDGERQNLPQRNAERLWYQHPRARPLRCPGPLCQAAEAWRFGAALKRFQSLRVGSPTRPTKIAAPLAWWMSAKANARSTAQGGSGNAIDLPRTVAAAAATASPPASSIVMPAAWCRSSRCAALCWRPSIGRRSARFAEHGLHAQRLQRRLDRAGLRRDGKTRQGQFALERFEKRTPARQLRAA